MSALLGIDLGISSVKVDERASERARVGAALIAVMGIGAINGGSHRFALRFDGLTAPNPQNAELEGAACTNSVLPDPTL